MAGVYLVARPARQNDGRSSGEEPEDGCGKESVREEGDEEQVYGKFCGARTPRAVTQLSSVHDYQPEKGP